MDIEEISDYINNLESEKLITDRKKEEKFKKYIQKAKDILNSEQLIKDVAYLLHVKYNIDNNERLKTELEKGQKVWNMVVKEQDKIKNPFDSTIKETMTLTSNQTLKNLIFT